MGYVITTCMEHMGYVITTWRSICILTKNVQLVKNNVTSAKLWGGGGGGDVQFVTKVAA